MVKIDKAQAGKDLLTKAINLLDDRKLSSAKRHVQLAVQEIEKVQNKEIKRQTTNQTILAQWNEKTKEWTKSLVDPQKSLEALEKLMKIEQDKLNKIKEGPEQQLLD